MRRLFISSAVAAASLGLVATGYAANKAPIDLASVPDGKVAICHFAGHDGDRLITGQGFDCEENNGEILIVAKKAAENGHGVTIEE